MCRLHTLCMPRPCAHCHSPLSLRGRRPPRYPGEEQEQCRELLGLSFLAGLVIHCIFLAIILRWYANSTKDALHLVPRPAAPSKVQLVVRGRPFWPSTPVASVDGSYVSFRTLVMATNHVTDITVRIPCSAFPVLIHGHQRSHPNLCLNSCHHIICPHPWHKLTYIPLLRGVIFSVCIWKTFGGKGD